MSTIRASFLIMTLARWAAYASRFVGFGLSIDVALSLVCDSEKLQKSKC